MFCCTCTLFLISDICRFTKKWQRINFLCSCSYLPLTQQTANSKKVKNVRLLRSLQSTRKMKRKILNIFYGSIVFFLLYFNLNIYAHETPSRELNHNLYFLYFIITYISIVIMTSKICSQRYVLSILNFYLHQLVVVTWQIIYYIGWIKKMKTCGQRQKYPSMSYLK